MKLSPKNYQSIDLTLNEAEVNSRIIDKETIAHALGRNTIHVIRVPIMQCAIFYKSAIYKALEDHMQKKCKIVYYTVHVDEQGKEIIRSFEYVTIY